MRTILLGTCLLAAAPALAQVADIRGLTFDASLSLDIRGMVQGQSLHLAQELTPLELLPHTFDVLPDPEAPKDPARILLRLRLPAGPEDPVPLRFEAPGTWDAGSGTLEASGVAPGVHFWQTPFEHDGFAQLDVPACVWLLLRDPRLDLHAIVVAPAGDGQLAPLQVAGGPAVQPATVAAQLELSSALVAWLPHGSGDDVTMASIGPWPLEDAAVTLPDLQASLVEVFGDMNDDLFLTQADVIAIHKLLGPTTAQDFEGDLVADGVVDLLDAAFLQWLVRVIGDAPLAGEPSLDAQAEPGAGKPLAALP